MGYWGRVVKRALKEACAEVRLDTPVRIVTSVISPIVAALGVGHLTGSIAWGGIAGVILLLFVWLCVFAGKIFIVPGVMAKEAEAERAALVAQLHSNAFAKAQLDDLGKFISEGEKLIRQFKQGQATETELERWVSILTEWTNQNLGDIYQSRLLSNAGYVFLGANLYENWLEGRIRRLHEFSQEITRSLST